MRLPGRGGQAQPGVGHRAKSFGLAVELRRGLYDIMAQWILEVFSLPSGHAL